MVTKVKCTNEGCELKGQIIPVATLYINKIAPLDGPYPCPKCGEPMSVAARIPSNHKGSAGAKPAPRRAVSRPVAKKTVSKPKVKKKTGLTVKGRTLGSPYKAMVKKTGAKKPGPRKRGPSK